MFVGFRQIDPTLDGGIDLSKEFAEAEKPPTERNSLFQRLPSSEPPAPGWRGFNPQEILTEGEPGIAVLSDDLADIYRDLHRGLSNVRAGHLDDACFEWSLGYRTHWGRHAVNALRTIKYCALAIIGFVVVSVIFMPLGSPEDDDGPQGVVMRLVVIFGAIVVATTAGMFERILKHAVDLKSENDLTV